MATKIERNTRLPSKPQYVRVELDADMAPEGPLRGGAWPGRKYVLVYHFFSSQEPTIRDCRKLHPGDRVCVNAGEYEGCFGTVLGKSWRYSGYTYGVRRARTEKVKMLVQVEKTAEFEVA
jgi:hypothetical protein